MRIGKFTGAYALLRVTWSVYPARLAPVDGALEINVPVSKRWRVHLDAGGTYGALLGMYGLGCAQALVRGSGSHKTVALTAGVGVSWAQFQLGPALSLGVEQRF